MNKNRLLLLLLVVFLGLYILLNNDSSNTELPLINSSDEYSKMVIKSVLLNTDKEIVNHIKRITVIERGGYNLCQDRIASEPFGCAKNDTKNGSDIYIVAIENWDSCETKRILNHEIGHVKAYYLNDSSIRDTVNKYNYRNNAVVPNGTDFNELYATIYAGEYIEKYENCKSQVIIALP